MVTSIQDFIQQGLSGGITTIESTRACVSQILQQIRRFQQRIRKHIEDNYVDFMPNHSASDIYIEEGENLMRDTEHLLKFLVSDAHAALDEGSNELIGFQDELREVSLGLRLSQRILRIDDLFQCVEEANLTENYLVVLDLLEKLKTLISCEAATDSDRLFQSCECYETIKVKYHIQANILQQNLRQKFERLVQLTDKDFPNAKHVTLVVSKDLSQLQDTVMALFQSRYNPMRICEFLYENCLAPIIQKSTLVQFSNDKEDYNQLNISYSLKESSKNLKPTYNQVFANINMLLECIANINVNIYGDQYVFSIIGNHIKDRFLKLLVDDCLMDSIPETMDEYHESTLVQDVLNFEQMLADVFLIDLNTDRVLSDFTTKFDVLFRNKFHKKVVENAREIMLKDLQDMVIIAEGNTTEELTRNPILFPQCMISKSTLELAKLLERILQQPSTLEDSTGNEDSAQEFVAITGVILEIYITEVPKVHEKLLQSIPQQAALYYNNCMFLAYWVAKNSAAGIPAHPALVKSLQTAGTTLFQTQVSQQQTILSEILKQIDLSDVHSINTIPVKLVRQSIRQMDLLKNVWLNVLPDSLYFRTFCDLINNSCLDIIKMIISLEDISVTVAAELTDLIDIIIEKVPKLFKENHDVLRVPCWMKLQQLKQILNASLKEITESWCEGAGILTANYTADEIRHLIRALFQNTDRRAVALSKII